jgi:hypothetical protein
MTFLVIALACVVVALALALIFNNTGLWQNLTGYSSSFGGLFIFALLGAAVGQFIGWGADFGPHPLDIWIIPMIGLSIAGLFVPAVILQA